MYGPPLPQMAPPKENAEENTRVCRAVDAFSVHPKVRPRHSYIRLQPRSLQQGKIALEISKSLGFNKDFKISKEDFKISSKI